MCERWLPNKRAAWAAGSDETDALPDHVGVVDCDDWGCWMVLVQGWTMQGTSAVIAFTVKEEQSGRTCPSSAIRGLNENGI
jgi:hypothetical protein